MWLLRCNILLLPALLRGCGQISEKHLVNKQVQLLFMGNSHRQHQVKMQGQKRKTNPPPATHIKARCQQYPRDPRIQRCLVPDDKVSWKVSYNDYAPVNYTAPSVLNKPIWADFDVRENKKEPPPKFNAIDGDVDRTSLNGKYEVENNVPRNIVGRTGIIGRGLLGRWGPNHAADPIVTRWKIKNGRKVTHVVSRKPILQFIAIQRADSGEWALPGGMVDPGETMTATLIREFKEEAMNSQEADNESLHELSENVTQFFTKNGREVYSGYVDDPRNTDNAWMETVAFNFHDETGESVGRFNLHAGDDAVGVRWIDIDSKLKLYASHTEFLEKTVALHNAHW